MICFYHLRLNLASIASVDLYRPYGPYGSWFLDLLVLLCLETQLAFVPNLDFGVSLTMHGIDEMPWKVFFVRGDLSIENNWILQNDKRRCMEVHKVHNTRQVPCSPWNIAEHRYRSNVHSLRAVHLHIGGRSRGQNHWSWKQLAVFSLTWSLRSKYFAVKSVICRCDSVNDCERFAPCTYIYVYIRYIVIYIYIQLYI